MKVRKLLKKHRISNGFDWKQASKLHKHLYLGNLVDPKADVDVESQNFAPARGRVLVIIDGAGPFEMHPEMVKLLIKMGVFKVVGRIPIDIEFNTFDFGI